MLPSSFSSQRRRRPSQLFLSLHQKNRLFPPPFSLLPFAMLFLARKRVSLNIIGPSRTKAKISKAHHCLILTCLGPRNFLSSSLQETVPCLTTAMMTKTVAEEKKFSSRLSLSVYRGPREERRRVCIPGNLDRRRRGGKRAAAQLVGRRVAIGGGESRILFSSRPTLIFFGSKNSAKLYICFLCVRSSRHSSTHLYPPLFSPVTFLTAKHGNQRKD